MVEAFEASIERARHELQAARASLNAELSHYPRPVSGCDAQFNHLWAERQKVSAALRALDEAVFVPTPRQPSPEVSIESR